ncbi:MAG: PLP-dependent aminotransferase family protein, partial [Vibrio gallaecicus]
PFEVDSSLLYRECQEQKIIILPGTVFGTKEQYKNCVRMSVANFEDTKDWRIGIEKFASLVSKHVAERNR